MKSPKRAKRLAAAVVAVVLAGAIAAAVGMVPAFGAGPITVVDQSYPTGTTAIADASTVDSYKQFPTGQQATSYDTTEFAGRLWTDKSVFVPEQAGTLGSSITIDLADSTRNLDPEGVRTTPGKLEVNKTAAGTFLTCVSALSSSLTTDLAEPIPLDIVLVLDLSGSMRDNYATNVKVPYTEYEVAHLVKGGLSNTQYLKYDGTYDGKSGFEGYCYIADNPDGTNNDGSNPEENPIPYINKYSNGNRLYIVTADANLVKPENRGPYNFYVKFKDTDGHVTNTDTYMQYEFYYTQLVHTSINKVFELKSGVRTFLDLIAENNSSLLEQGYADSSLSRISVVSFASQYAGGSWSTTTPNYAIGAGSSINTRIVTPLTMYASSAEGGAIEDVSVIKDTIDSLDANQTGSTAADFGLTLANGVLAGDATIDGVPQSGARDEATKVVIFFTDGNPKHEKGSAPNDFSGYYAQQTLDVAKELKDDGALVYSVAVLPGADETDTTLNANIYLNGVSSNYLDAYAEGGQDNPVSGLVVPAANTWTPHLQALNYVKTSDSEVQAGKTYYAQSGDGYVEVAEPDSADLADYYETPSYYLVAGGDRTLADAFSEIAMSITSSAATDSSSTGRDGNTAVTITDYLGDYMEFKGLDGILYGITADATKFYAPGTQGAYHEQAQVQRDDASATQSTYTMWPKDLVPSALLEPAEGREQVSLNLITVKVTRSTDPKTGDTVTLTIPPELIPSLRYSVKQKPGSADESTLTVVERADADPLRIFYSVGPKASTLSDVISQMEEQALRSENATNETDRQTAAYKSFMEDAAAGEDGFYKLLNNAWPSAAEGSVPENGSTEVAMTLADTNPFYYYQNDEALYIDNGDGGYSPAKTSNYAAGDKLYVKHRVWSVGETDDEIKYIEFSGTPAVKGNSYYAPAGTPKVSEGDYTSASIAKADGANATSTAESAIAALFTGGTTAAQYLGNNGMLSIPVKGTLAVTKNIKAGAGFDLPTDPAPSAHFTLRIYDKDGAPLTQQSTYRALIRDANGHPIDPTTHAQVTSADAAKFYVVDDDSFELRDGETLKVTNLPDGATYQVKETGQAGYAATVTNNDGTTEQFERGRDAVTASPAGG